MPSFNLCLGPGCKQILFGQPLLSRPPSPLNWSPASVHSPCNPPSTWQPEGSRHCSAQSPWMHPAHTSSLWCPHANMPTCPHALGCLLFNVIFHCSALTHPSGQPPPHGLGTCCFLLWVLWWADCSATSLALLRSLGKSAALIMLRHPVPPDIYYCLCYMFVLYVVRSPIRM